MKRFLKLAAVSLGLLGLAAASALFVLYRLFPPERIKALALAEAQAKLHREIRLADADIGLFGVSLRGLEISEAPDFKAGVMAKARIVHVRPDLLSLLRRRWEISDILLSGWECDIARRADGAWNFQDSAGAPGAPPSATSSAPSAEQNWEIGRVRIEQGTVRYADEVSRSAYSLKNVEISARRVRPRGEVPFDLSADYSGKSLEGRVELRASADLGGLDPARMSLKWSSLKLRHQGLRIEGSGRVQNLSAPEMSLQVSLPRQSLAARDAARWPSQLRLLIPLQAQAELRKAGDKVTVSQAKVVWNSLRGEIRGTIALKENASPELHLRLKTGEFSLADMAGLLPVAQKVGPKGQGHVDLAVDGPAQSPALSGEASVKGVSLSYEGQSLSGLEASAKFSPSAIAAQAQGTLNRGKFRLDFDVRDYRNAPTTRVTGEIAELDLGFLSKASSAPADAKTPQGPGTKTAGEPSSAPLRSSGKLSIGKVLYPNFTTEKVTLEWNLKNANIPARMTGSVKLNTGRGRMEDISAASQNGLVQALLLPISVLRKAGGIAGMPRLQTFDRMTGDYAIENGVMTIREMHTESNEAYNIVTGKADLAKETLDMHLSSRLLHLSERLQLPGLTGPFGFKISGTFSNPSIKPDVTSILKQPGVEKLLNNLFR